MSPVLKSTFNFRILTPNVHTYVFFLLSDVQRERKGLVENKTVSVLSQVNSITDLPIPSPIQNLYGTGRKMLKRPEGFDMDNLSQCTG